jgi:eukaryotic-like serine/threonine-protein kinase
LFYRGALASLAHLQLARAKLLSHENDAARQAYQDFFALWKNGDTELPISKQAKAEFAKLR